MLLAKHAVGLWLVAERAQTISGSSVA